MDLWRYCRTFGFFQRGRASPSWRSAVSEGRVALDRLVDVEAESSSTVSFLGLVKNEMLHRQILTDMRRVAKTAKIRVERDVLLREST